MQLTWDKGYEDYTDRAHWLPRYEKLVLHAKTLDIKAAASASDEKLLNDLEYLEELMRYYGVENNMNQLEPVMRSYNALMDICRSRRLSGPEVMYLEMVFLRINALLYRAHNQQRKSLEEYGNCLKIAARCFSAALSAAHLSQDQQLYITWNCIECWREAAEVSDALADFPRTLSFMKEATDRLEKLIPWLPDSPGLSDQASELFANTAGSLYQNGDPAAADRCFSKAIQLLNQLDERYGSDFYRARAIWHMGVQGYLSLVSGRDGAILLQAEREAAQYLALRPKAEPRDRAIAESTQAIVTFQRSIACQQNGSLPDAIRLAKESISKLEQALDILEADSLNHKGYYCTILHRIASRIYNMCLTAKESLGIQCYQNGDLSDADAVLKDVLEELSKTEGLRMSGSSAVLIQAEVLQYLSLIACDRDANQAEFYATQSADLAVSLGKDSGNGNGWILAITSCSLAAEMALDGKNKDKAARYAQMGLDACDMVSRMNPSEPHLELRSTLAKLHKKATRKFLW